MSGQVGASDRTETQPRGLLPFSGNEYIRTKNKFKRLFSDGTSGGLRPKAAHALGAKPIVLIHRRVLVIPAN